MKTYPAVEAAHGHAMDILRLNRSDNLGVRSLIPALRLRMGMDQEAYDFCEWWAVVLTDRSYDWGDETLPFLDIKDADVFETLPPATLLRAGDLSHNVAMTLLKVRLLVDVRALRSSKLIEGKVPPEILDRVRKMLVVSEVIAGRRDLLDGEGHGPLIAKLEKQVLKLVKVVEVMNRYVSLVVVSYCSPSFLPPQL